MSIPQQYDIIIAGAGASGLSLLWELLNSDILKQNRILLVDRTLQASDDKTWCFWDDNSIPQTSGLIYHTWNSLEVRAHQNRYSENLSDYKYHCVRSIDYSSKILEYARRSDNVKMLEADILQFNPVDDMAEIKTSKGTYRASWIFQSALKPAGLEQSKVDISLMQHFMGWEIMVNEDLFNPDRALLMDFDVPQKNGVTFLYVLPFSRQRALVEFTLFSDSVLTDDEYESGIKEYLLNRYGLSEKDYTIHRKEKGVIPMEDRRYPARYCNRVYNIGTMGGLTKPSTGYTFTRIHRQSKEIVKALEKGNPPPISGRSSYRFRVYDIMMLYLIKNDTDIAITIFGELFRQHSFDRILQFLEEKTHPGQEVKIFASLPRNPFFKSIWKMKHRIFTGA